MRPLEAEAADGGFHHSASGCGVAGTAQRRSFDRLRRFRRAGRISLHTHRLPRRPRSGRGEFTNDFEPYHLNNRGELAFAADLSPSGGEGVFFAQEETLTELARFGTPAPGGGTFSKEVSAGVSG